MKLPNLYVLALAAAVAAFSGPRALAAAPIAPATRPAPTSTLHTVHRITGLFSADREADLRAALEKIPGVELISLDFDHAEATLAYDPTKAFPGVKPDKIVERFDQQLKAASNHTLGVKPLSTTPRDKLTRVEFGLAPLDCKACCLGVYEMLAKVDGVEQAMVSMKDGRVTALIDPEKTSREQLRATLKQREVTLKQP